VEVRVAKVNSATKSEENPTASATIYKPRRIFSMRNVGDHYIHDIIFTILAETQSSNPALVRRTVKKTGKTHKEVE
jgi:hypothetical protein